MAEQTTPQPDDDVLDEFLAPLTQRIRGRDGAVKTYVIRETVGGEDYWDWLARLTALQQEAEKGGPVEKVRANAKLQVLEAEFVEQCVTVDGQVVTKEIVLSWGQSHRQRVFSLCLTQNGLDVGAVVREKKDLSDPAASETGTGSPAASAGPSPAAAGS